MRPAVTSLVVVRVVHVGRTVASGTDRLVDLTAARITADLLHLVLQFAHLPSLRQLLDLLLLDKLTRGRSLHSAIYDAQSESLRKCQWRRLRRMLLLS